MSSSLSSGACLLSQEKAETNGETDLPLFSHLKRLESYPAQMSDISLSGSSYPLFQVIFWSCSGYCLLSTRWQTGRLC